MSDRPTPETDAFFRSFADGDATPSHAEYYDRMTQLERERDEGRDTITDVLSALVAMEHEGPRLAALRVRGERDEAREQRDKLAKAAKLIAYEYESRRCQFGGDYLWMKHEQGSAVENALAIINEHHHE